MRVRHLVAERKVIVGDTGWQSGELPPRHSRIYPRSRPALKNWQWRSTVAHSEQNEYVLLTQVNEEHDNWKAWLIKCGGPELGSLVARFEYHGSHPGTHVHAHCARGGIEVGPTGINDLVRIPKASSGPVITLRRDSFWEQARRRFRIEFPEGTLM